MIESNKSNASEIRQLLECWLSKELEASFFEVKMTPSNLFEPLSVKITLETLPLNCNYMIEKIVEVINQQQVKGCTVVRILIYQRNKPFASAYKHFTVSKGKLRSRKPIDIVIQSIPIALVCIILLPFLLPRTSSMSITTPTAPSSGLQKTPLGSHPSGYSLWLGSDGCVYRTRLELTSR